MRQHVSAYFTSLRVFNIFLGLRGFLSCLLLENIFKYFELLKMLVYSRNILISLRNWHKTLKLSPQSYGSVARPISEEVWQRLAFYNLLMLAPTRGQRGSGSHLKDHRPMLNRRKKYCTQNLPNRSNLLNIEVRTDGIKSVTTTPDEQKKSKPGSNLRVAHLNTRSLKNRSHIVLR